MIEGAFIFLAGLVIGHFWSTFTRGALIDQNRLIRKLISKKAKIIDTSPEVDLGEEKKE